MTQEEKILLLRDLCARLPYRVKVKSSRRRESVTLSLDVMTDFHLGCSVKPYLRPLSSMTEEEKKEMHNLLSPEGTAIYENNGISIPMNHYGDFVPYEFMNRIIQCLLKNHFDFMGLIPKGLAIEVTEENNPYKK